MPEFLVRWEIEVEAEDVEQAAREAKAIMHCPGSEAFSFEVRKATGKAWRTVDLTGEEVEAWLVVAGDIVEGLEFFGPFESEDAAADFGTEKLSQRVHVIAPIRWEV